MFSRANYRPVLSGRRTWVSRRTGGAARRTRTSSRSTSASTWVPINPPTASSRRFVVKAGWASRVIRITGRRGASNQHVWRPLLGDQPQAFSL